MEIYLDCLPCVLRQALEASRMSTEDIELQKLIMDDVLNVLNQYKTFRNPPEIGREIHRIVKNRTGISDPYYQIKQKDLCMALGLYPRVKHLVESREDRLYWALKAAAIGNALDSAICIGYDMGKDLNEELEKPFAFYDISVFNRQMKTAKNLLVIGDNAGETVFDCLLLEQFPNLELTYAVRSSPIINDATIEEARSSGLDQYARIVSTSCDAPGVLLEECNQTFLDIFYGSDIVISKGQGNYETLSDSDCGRDVYFLLKVKCPVLSEIMNVELNKYVFKHDKCGKIHQ